MSQVSIIIGREFNERVRKKSFIITTLLMPLLMIGLMFAPMLIMKYSRGDEKQIAVIDDSVINLTLLGALVGTFDDCEPLLFALAKTASSTSRTR